MRRKVGAKAALGAALLALAFGLLAAAAEAAQTTVQKPQEAIFLELPAKHGERASLILHPLDGWAVVELEKGDPEIPQGRWSGAGFATSMAVGPEPSTVDITFGEIGSVSGSLWVAAPPSGAPETVTTGRCLGPKPLSLSARFDGTVDLGLAGYLSVRGEKKGIGIVQRSFEMRCKKQDPYRSEPDPTEPFGYLPHPVQTFMGIDNPILISSLHRRHRWVEMWAATEATREQPSTFRAEALEWLPGEIATVRWAEASRVAPAAIAFGAGDPPRSALLEPPAPFSGSARFARRSHSLRGNLAVRLPGGLRVRIGSRDSRTRVCDLELRHDACR